MCLDWLASSCHLRYQGDARRTTYNIPPQMRMIVSANTRSTATLLVSLLRMQCDPNLVFTLKDRICVRERLFNGDHRLPSTLLILQASGEIARLNPVVEAAVPYLDNTAPCIDTARM